MTSPQDADTQPTSDMESDIEKPQNEKTSNIPEEARDKETLQERHLTTHQDGLFQEKDTSPQSGPVPTDDEYVYVTGLNLIVVITVVALSAFVMLLDTSIVVTAIPRITTQFHSLNDVGWYGSAYLISSSSLQPMTGKIYAQFSSKYTFMCFLGLFEFGSLICGVATSSKMFIVGRAVAGMGAAGIMNGGLTIISACVPLEKRPLYLGFLMSIAQMGILFGPLIGGALTEYAIWRWCFYINLPIGGLVIIAIFFSRIPDRVVKPAVKPTIFSTLSTLDIPGFLLFAPTSVMFLLALEWGGTEYPWNSATIIGLFCGSAGMLAVFLAWEYKQGDSAMVPFSMVRKRVVYTASLSLFFFFGSLLLTSYYLSIYFQGVKGVTPMLSGVYLLPGILSQMVAAISSGILVTRVGYYLPFSIASGVLTTLGSGLISTFKPNTSIGRWIGYQIIAGFGRGLGIQMPIVAVQNNLPQSQTAVSLSVLIFAQNFGGAVWLAVAQTAFDNSLKKGLAQYAPAVTFEQVLAAGASGIRSKLPRAAVTGVIIAYDHSVNTVFYVATGVAFGALIFSAGMGWKRVANSKNAKKKEEEAAGAGAVDATKDAAATPEEETETAGTTPLEV